MKKKCKKIETKCDINLVCSYTDTPVARSHLWDKEKWPVKTDDLLKKVQFT